MTIPKTLATLGTDGLEVPEISTLMERVVDLKTLYSPNPLILQSVDFAGIIPLSPDKTPPEISFLYQSLAETVQAVINGKINDFISYDGAGRINIRRFRTSSPEGSTTSLKEEVQIYKASVKKLMDEQGGKGFPGITGEFSERLGENLLLHKTTLINHNKNIYNNEQNDILAKVELGIKAANTVEIILFDSHNHIQAVTLESASRLVDNAYQVFNIEVEKYNTELQANNILISTKLDEFKNKLLPLEEFSLKVRGKSLENENSRLSNSLYTSAVNYIITQTESINSNIDLLELEAEEERQKILRYKAEVGKFEALVNQNVANVEAYRSRVKAESVKLETYRAQVRTADALLRAQSAQTQVNSTSGQADVDIVNANLAVADAELTEARILLENAVREGRVVQTKYEKDLVAYTEDLQNWFTDTTDEIFRERKFKERNTREKIENLSNTQTLKRDQKRINTTNEHKITKPLSLANIATSHIQQVSEEQATTELVSNLIHTVLRGPS